jgi:hypothetical protein
MHWSRIGTFLPIWSAATHRRFVWAALFGENRGDGNAIRRQTESGDDHASMVLSPHSGEPEIAVNGRIHDYYDCDFLVKWRKFCVRLQYGIYTASTAY